MNFRPMLIVNTLLVLAMAGLSAWAWNQIPDGAQVPVHFDIHGQPNGYADKSEALVIMPAIVALVTMCMWLLPRFDPRQANILSSLKFWNATAILVAALLAYTHALMVGTALGYSIDMISALVPALGIMFIGIGNYLGKTRSNWFGGVRTPWTMSSEYAWTRTHRLAGQLFMMSGVATLAVWATLGAMPAFIVQIASVIVSALLSVVASYFYWKNDPERAGES